MEACAECSRSCLALHRTKLDPHPIVSSFFKVMFGNQFSEILVVPQRFNKTVVGLEGKTTCLEDSTGQKWTVNVCNVNGSLAFQKGWHEFSVDHGIELGDFLVFHYFKGSHFIVEIFGRSGCEKPILFNGKHYQNTRAKLSKDSIPSYEDPPAKARLDSCLYSCLADVDVNERNDDMQHVKKLPEMLRVNVPRQEHTNKRPKLAPTTDFFVESYFMTNRDTSYTREDDRRGLFDLSIFEMPEVKEDANKRTSVVSNEADWSRKEHVSLPNYTISRVDMPLDVSMPIKSIALPPASEVSALAASCEAPAASPETPWSGRLMINKQESKSDEDVCVNTVPDNLSCISTISSSTDYNRKLKNETPGRHSTSTEEDKDQRDLTLNPKFCALSSAPDFKITCSVQQDSETHLELPKPLPINVHKQGENSKQNQVVLLRDPVGRLWPVIHHCKEGLGVLENGWKQFRKSNNIQSGDECTFVVENINQGIFEVQIIRLV